MLADIDRDVAAYDNTVDVNEAGRDLFFDCGDAITIALRDGAAWQVESVQNTDILDVKSHDAFERTGRSRRPILPSSPVTRRLLL